MACQYSGSPVPEASSTVPSSNEIGLSAPTFSQASPVKRLACCEGTGDTHAAPPPPVCDPRPRPPEVEAIWVADLKISKATADKISSLHHITGQEVKDAVVCVRGLRCTWEEDPERGRRALVR